MISGSPFIGVDLFQFHFNTYAGKALGIKVSSDCYEVWKVLEIQKRLHYLISTVQVSRGTRTKIATPSKPRGAMEGYWGCMQDRGYRAQLMRVNLTSHYFGWGFWQSACLIALLQPPTSQQKPPATKAKVPRWLPPCFSFCCLLIWKQPPFHPLHAV